MKSESMAETPAKKIYKSRNYCYCSIFNCTTKCPNMCDVHLHGVKPEWLDDPNIQWKSKRPRHACDLHFEKDDFISDFVAGRKKNYLKVDSKPHIK